MITRTLIFFLFTFASVQLQAQVNYVLNPSFEHYAHCPIGTDQINLANFWSAIDSNKVYELASDGQPELCNTCAAASTNVSVPRSGYYYHFPRTGNGMAMMITFCDESFPDTYNRDYLQGRLYKSLVAGKIYCVTFFVTLTQSAQYANNQIGAYFDNGIIDTTTQPGAVQTEYTPQVVETTVINDTLNWVKVQGSFTANGTEKYITIGNFFDKAHTSVTSLPYSASTIGLYLVDDVSVIENTEKAVAGPDGFVWAGSDSVFIGSNEEGLPVTWYVLGNTNPINYNGGFKVHPDTTTTYVVKLDLCNNVTYDTVVVKVVREGVSNLQPAINQAKVYPNPASNELHVEDAGNSEVCIYNLLGQEVFSAHHISNKEVLNVDLLISGVYVVQITFSDGSKQSRRLVKE